MGIHIEKVDTENGWDGFINCPYLVYRNDPNWVAPLISAITKQLGPNSEFKQYGEFQAFLATQNNVPVGRIVASINYRLNEKEGKRIGLFGYFECIDDQNLACELIKAATNWLLDRQCTELRGPIDLSTHNNCLCLVDGFDDPPTIMMPYNPPYYPKLFEGAGFTVAKNAFAFFTDTVGLPRVFERSYNRALKAGVTFRPMHLKSPLFEQDCRKLYRVFSESFSNNWSATERTEPEFLAAAQDLKQVADPALIPIAELNGEMIGLFIALPDINIALRQVKGRLNLPGILKLLWYRRKMYRMRVLAIGVLPQYQNIKYALGPALTYFFERSIRTQGKYKIAELSWIWEDNMGSLGIIKSLGGRHYKTYSIYQKSLRPTTETITQ